MPTSVADEEEFRATTSEEELSATISDPMSVERCGECLCGCTCGECSCLFAADRGDIRVGVVTSSSGREGWREDITSGGWTCTARGGSPDPPPKLKGSDMYSLLPVAGAEGGAGGLATGGNKKVWLVS